LTQKEKVLGFINENMKIPMTAEEIGVMLSVPAESMDELCQILDELEAEGSIIKTKRCRYASIEASGFAVGMFSGNERGFGFVERKIGDDIFVGKDEVGGALHGDTVLVKIHTQSDSEKRAEGMIVKIIQSAAHRIVGRFYEKSSGGFVTPVNRRYAQDIYVESQNKADAQNGDMVVLNIVKRGDETKKPEGRVISVIGNINTPGVDILSAIESKNIPYQFEQDVLHAAENVAQAVSERDIEGRLDLREETIITIDGDDAKDLDDAVHVKKLSNGNFELGVHIADVGHYVPYNSIIDREAYARGTSIYLADRVIPMLPEILSNGICSLNEGKERLTISVIMEIDPNGAVVAHNIAESVICSKKRMTYTDVTKILEGDAEKRKMFSHLVNMLDDMAKLKTILRKKRVLRGSIDFNFDEARIVLDENGKPVDIVKRERGISNGIIEEFMLVCNETVAEHMFWLGIPFIYRIHEEPATDTIKEFIKFIAPLGYHIKHANGKVHPREIAELIRALSGKKEEMIISNVALRSLMKARYSDENLGHFGLASSYYCHFTSPIRRYPDLAIHRIIKSHLRGELPTQKLATFVKDAAKQSSDRELEAVDLERTVEDMKKAEFMHDRTGDVYDAVITNITQFGMFAALENTIEGLIRLSDLDDDYYLYDERSKTLTGERTGKIFKVGEKIKIRVARAEAQTGKIDFVLENTRQKHDRILKKRRESDNMRKQTKIKTARYLKKRRKKR